MRIFAYTASFNFHPEYINVTPLENGSTILTVRTQGENQTSKINLPPEQLEALGKWFLARAAEFKAA